MSGVQKSKMNTKNQRNILVVVILLLLGGVGYLYSRVSSLSGKVESKSQNVKALKDSVRVSKNKVDELEYSKNVLVSKKENLKELNEELSNELEKEKGKVRELTKMVNNISKDKNDTITTTNELVSYPDSTFGLKWEFDTTFSKNNSRYLSGVSKFTFKDKKLSPLETELIDHSIDFSMTSGLREKDGNIEFFVRSDYPGFSTKEIHSSIINPNEHPVMTKFTSQKRLGIGPYVGVGINNKLQPRFQIGVGVTYHLYEFNL